MKRQLRRWFNLNSLSIKSYAKFNLYLRVLERRSDNYHNILTIFERIDLHDQIILKNRKDTKIKIICTHPDVPSNQSNLAYKAADLLRKKLKINKGIEIKIKKRIPVAAGLGGGSSNAATVLLGLNRLWCLGLSKNRLISYAKILGADVAFFVTGVTFAIGSQRGDQIRKLNINKKFWHILIAPTIKVSTKSVYKALKRVKKVCLFRLTSPQADVKMLTSRLREKKLTLLKEALFNQLEIPACKVYPKLRKLKSKAKMILNDTILISGSGPAMFVFVSSRKEGERLGRRLEKYKDWGTFLVKTI